MTVEVEVVFNGGTVVVDLVAGSAEEAVRAVWETLKEDAPIPAHWMASADQFTMIVNIDQVRVVQVQTA